jgi:hypothetical protein
MSTMARPAGGGYWMAGQLDATRIGIAVCRPKQRVKMKMA